MNLLNALRSVIVGVGLVGSIGAASADVVYTFDSKGTILAGTGPYGTVTLQDTGADINFTVSLRSDLDFVNTGNHSVFSFNATDVATTDVINILFNGIAGSGSLFTVETPGTNPPFGNNTFTLMIDCTNDACKNGNPGKSIDPLTFTVKNAEFTDFGFLAAGTTSFFAADVICVNTLAGGCTSVGSTGAIGVTQGPPPPPECDNDPNTTIPDCKEPPNETPEPASLALLGLGLLGLGIARRRKV